MEVMTEERRSHGRLSEEELETLREVVKTWREAHATIKFIRIVGRILYWGAGVALGVAAFLGIHHGVPK